MDDDEAELLIATQAAVQINLTVKRTLSIPHVVPKKGVSLGTRQLHQLPSFTTLVVATLPSVGDVVFAGRQKGEIVAWRVSLSKNTYMDGDVLGTHKGAVTAMCYYPRSNLLISGGADCAIKVFDPTATDGSKNRCIQTIPGHDATVTTLAAHCNLILSGSADKTLKLWKFDEDRDGLAYPWLAVKQVFIFDAWVNDIWASPSKDAETSAGEVFVADGGGGITVLRSLTAHSDNAEEVIASGLELLRHSEKTSGSRFSEVPKAIVKVLPILGLNLLINVSFEDKVRISDIAGFQELVTVPHPDDTKRFVDVAWLSDHEELLLIDNVSRVWLWNTKNNTFSADVEMGMNATKVVCHHGEGGPTVWLAHREGVQQLQIDRMSSFVKYQGHQDRILGIFINPLSSAINATTATAAAAKQADVDDIDYHFLTASVDNTVCLWTQSMTLIKTYREKYSEISCFHVMAANGWCITGHDNGSMKFWNLAKDRTFRFVAHDNTISAVGEGYHRAVRGNFESWHHLFSISFDGCLSIWEMPLEGSKAKCEARVRVSNSELLAAVYDDINKAYIIGDNNGEVTVWSVDELKPLRSLQHATGSLKGVAHAEAVTCLVLDGNYAFTGGEDSSLFLWNSVTGRLAKELFYEGPDGLGEVEYITVLNERNGELLVATRSGQIVLFSQETGYAIHEHKLSGVEVVSLCWSANTEEIVAGMDDGMIMKIHISMLTPMEPPQNVEGTAGAPVGDHSNVSVKEPTAEEILEDISSLN